MDIPKIEEYYVAYFDILGYKAYFDENPDKAEELLEKVYGSIEDIISNIDNLNMVVSRLGGIEKMFGCKTFSDNIIIYYKSDRKFPNNYMLLGLIEIIKNIQINLIVKYGIFIRGGVTKGAFAANEKFVFGKALIKVVELETNVAKSPRIVIDDKLIKELETPNITMLSNEKIVLDEMEEVMNGIFINSDYRTLYDRIRKIVDGFEKILKASIYQISHVEDSSKNFLELLPQIRSLSANSISYDKIQLENIYRDIKSAYPTIVSLAKTIIQKQLTTMNDYNNARYMANIIKGEDGICFIDYISVLDFKRVLDELGGKVETALEQFELIFKDKEELIQGLSNTLKSDSTVIIENYLKAHKLRVEGNLAKYSKNPSILNKYIEVKKFHNTVCYSHDLEEYLIE